MFIPTYILLLCKIAQHARMNCKYKRITANGLSFVWEPASVLMSLVGHMELFIYSSVG